VTAKLKTMGELFMARRPEREIIVPCVRWRLRNKLSLRDRVLDRQD
jgi:transposase-like protein